MSKDWSYAKMAQDAANAGGPDKWREVIKKAAYDAGASDMKNALVLPLLAAGMGIGAVSVIGGKRMSGKGNAARLYERIEKERCFQPGGARGKSIFYRIVRSGVFPLRRKPGKRRFELRLCDFAFGL